LLAYDKLISRQKLTKTFKITLIFSLIFTFGGGSVTLFIGLPEFQFYSYDADPYLTWNNLNGITQDPSTSITICWHSKFISSSIVKYGKDPNKLDNIKKEYGLGRFHKVSLGNLDPNTTYYYKIDGFSLKKFYTPPKGNFNYSFFIWSDPRTNNPYSDAIEGISIPKIITNHLIEWNWSFDNFAFSICAGDIVSRGVDYRDWKLWLNDITFNDFASNHSHIVAIGNHERHDDISARNFLNYYPYLNKPEIHFSFSFNYGCVHFIILDRWYDLEPWYGGNGLAQAEWLKKDLIENNQSNFKILIMHPNPLLNDEHSGNCTLIKEVAKNYRVDVIFCGHWHYYLPTDFDLNQLNSSIVENLCMMIGNGGTWKSLDYNGYARVDVSSDMLKIYYFISNSSIPKENYIILKK